MLTVAFRYQVLIGLKFCAILCKKMFYKKLKVVIASRGVKYHRTNWVTVIFTSTENCREYDTVCTLTEQGVWRGQLTHFPQYDILQTLVSQSLQSRSLYTQVGVREMNTYFFISGLAITRAAKSTDARTLIEIPHGLDIRILEPHRPD